LFNISNLYKIYFVILLMRIIIIKILIIACKTCCPYDNGAMRLNLGGYYKNGSLRSKQKTNASATKIFGMLLAELLREDREKPPKSSSLI